MHICPRSPLQSDGRGLQAPTSTIKGHSYVGFEGKVTRAQILRVKAKRSHACIASGTWCGCVDISPSACPLAVTLTGHIEKKKKKKSRLNVEFGASPVTTLGVVLLFKENIISNADNPQHQPCVLGFWCPSLDGTTGEDRKSVV